MSKSAKAWAHFDYWFNHRGHWMFGTNGEAKAIAVWSGHGIDGLPNYPGPRE